MRDFRQISNDIFSIADRVLRNKFEKYEYGDVILPFIVLRRLDCVLENKKNEAIKLHNKFKKSNNVFSIITKRIGIKFYNYSKYDLKILKEDSKNLSINFKKYLSGFSDNVIDIIENFKITDPVKTLVENDRFFGLLNEITSIDLHPDKIDNHLMGQIYEDILRRFKEASNSIGGEHYTPRDIVKLLVTLVFSVDKQKLSGKGIVRSIYDPCCGTAGMLTIGKEWVKENINPNADFILTGQETKPSTYAIAKSDMLMTDEDSEKIFYGSSLSKDALPNKKFDYLITNPPFGDDWKYDKDFVMREAANPNGRFTAGTPTIRDGSFLFLQHLISKMEKKGSRIGIIFNGGPLFNGDAGSGESNIRRWIFDNDWLESIVSLPNDLFFQTNISTFILTLTNKKNIERKNKIQLIDASKFYSNLRKSLGKKRKNIDESHIKKILDIFYKFEENEYSKIYSREYFGYTKIKLYLPQKSNLTIKDINKYKKDFKIDFEKVPLNEDIQKYLKKEVYPFYPNALRLEREDKIGYEINFSRYFYKYIPPRSLKEIENDLQKYEKIISKQINQLN